MPRLRFQDIDLRVGHEVSVEFRWFGGLDDLETTTLALWMHQTDDEESHQPGVLAVEHTADDEVRTYCLAPGGAEPIPCGRVVLLMPGRLVAEFPVEVLPGRGVWFTTWARLSVGDEVVDRWGEDPGAAAAGWHEQDVDVLAGTDGWGNGKLVEIAERLTHAEGDLGVAALRTFAGATGPGSEDLRTAALLALGERCGAAAGPDLLQALRTGPIEVRALAAEGILHLADATIWDEVLAWYESWLATPRSRRRPIPPAMPISYLVLHASGNPQRAAHLVTFLRVHWDRLLPFEQQWIHGFVPRAAPGGPSADQVLLPGRDQLPYGPDGLFAAAQDTGTS